jgi:Domain of unknown function (DUF4373)
MPKDAYYLQHDINAQEDPKCIILIEQLGMEGYGIFWALVERLRQEAHNKLPLTIIPPLSRRWNTSKEKVESVVKNYDLFIVENSHFFSNRLCKDANEFKETKRTLSEAGKRGNLIRWQSGGDQAAIGKQSQISKVSILSKVNKILVGIKFFANNTKVKFSDGSSQQLGEDQLNSLKNGQLRPRDVVKGNKY